MKFAKLALGLGLAGLASAHAAVNYVGDVSTTDRSTIIDLSVDPSGTYGGSYDSVSKTWTWSASDTFVLQEVIVITNGTLVIEAGSIVRGQPRSNGSTFDGGSLLIARSAKILANGDASTPIIFTTASTTGNNTAHGGRASGATPTFWDADPLGTPQSSATAGLWGGLLVLGDAPTNADRNPATTEVQFFGETTGLTATTDDRGGIEGMDATWSVVTSGNDRFGGNIEADNSGSLKYISLRHGGANVGSNSEVNGLTLGGIGYGTTVDYIEVWGNTDDGLEIFGGTVNVKHVAIFNAQDDGIDLDTGYTGTIQYALVVGGNQSDNLGEWDGSYEDETVNGFTNPSPVSATYGPTANYAIYNATFIGAPAANGSGVGRHGILIRDQAAPRLVNAIVVNPRNQAGQALRLQYGPNGASFTVNQAAERSTPDRFAQGIAAFKGVQFYSSTNTSLDTHPEWNVNHAATATQTLASTEITSAANANTFNVDPGFSGLPTTQPQALLPTGLAINPVPQTPEAPVFDDEIVAANASIEFAPYRGAFQADNTVALWTNDWTAADAADVVVKFGDGTN